MYEAFDAISDTEDCIDSISDTKQNYYVCHHTSCIGNSDLYHGFLLSVPVGLCYSYLCKPVTLTLQSPVSAFWTLSFVPQHCINEKWHLLSQGILNIIGDFLVVLIPIPVVLRLHLPRRQRIIVAVLFGAGFVVCFAGIVRTYYFYKLTKTNHDITWDAFPVWVSTAVELYIGIVRIHPLCTNL
jgi:hypothetical protein